jgi:GDPmannose 4,6-dehydratase
MLVGDATKAREVLGWRPRYTFEELVAEMVQSDLEATSRQARDNPASLAG